MSRTGLLRGTSYTVLRTLPTTNRHTNQNTESEIRALLEKTADATRGEDIDALLRHYAARVPTFDVMFRAIYT